LLLYAVKETKFAKGFANLRGGT